MIERQTYSLLELMGDVGGLFDCLIIIGKFLVLPIASFALNEILLQSLQGRKPKITSQNGLAQDKEKLPSP